MAFSEGFLQLGTTCPGLAPLRVGLGLPHQSWNQENTPTDLPIGQCYGGIIFQPRCQLSPGNSRFVSSQENQPSHPASEKQNKKVTVDEMFSFLLFHFLCFKEMHLPTNPSGRWWYFGTHISSISGHCCVLLVHHSSRPEVLIPSLVNPRTWFPLDTHHQSHF